jgi:sugar phosphate isomerase/epimerase
MVMKKYLLPLFLSLLMTAAVAQPPIGLQMGTFGKQLRADLQGTLTKMKELGITEVEGGGAAGMDAESYRKLLGEYNIKVVAIGSNFDSLRLNPAKYVKLAKALGAEQVICYWVPHTGDVFTIEDAKKGVAVFNAAGEVLAQEGLALCYHAHGYEFGAFEDATLFDYMARNMNPRYANFQMDVFWIKQSGTDPVALLNKYPTRFKSMHLKDRLKGMPDSSNGRADVEKANVVLGTGDVNIEAIMKEGVRRGILHYFIEDESSRSWDQVPQSIEFLKKIRY